MIVEITIGYDNDGIYIYKKGKQIGFLSPEVFSYRDAIIFTGTIICNAYTNFLNSFTAENKQTKISGFQQ